MCDSFLSYGIGILLLEMSTLCVIWIETLQTRWLVCGSKFLLKVQTGHDVVVFYGNTDS